MAKSSVSDILAAQRAVQALDRKGRLAILNDLKKQDLTLRTKADARMEGAPAKVIAKYGEGVES